MTSGFFRSVLSVVLLAIVCGSAPAQVPTPAATPAPEEKKPKLGYFRLWNMLPAEAGELHLLQDSGSGEPTVLVAAEPMNVSAEYVGAKPGRYALKVVRAAEPKIALKNFDVVLKAGVFVTFHARPVEGKLALDMIDDTYDLEKTTTGSVTFRQLVKDATVTIKSSALPQPAVLNFGVERLVENLPLKAVVFQMQATMPDGKSKNWTVEIDFRLMRHATIFLTLDIYGRFRPRSIADGQAEVDYSKQ